MRIICASSIAIAALLSTQAHAASNTTTAPGSNSTAAVTSASVNGTGWVAPLEIDGYKLFDSVAGNEFRVKGVAYYPRANSGKSFNADSVDFFTDERESIWKPQLANFKALGINTVRLYAVDPSVSHDKFMCELSKLGMYAFVGMSAM